MISFIVLCAGAIALGAVAYSTVDLPFAWAVPYSTVCVCIGCVGAGAVLAALQGCRAILCGVAAGALGFAALGIYALCSGTGSCSALLAFKLLCALLAGAIGGIGGNMLRQKQKKKRR